MLQGLEIDDAATSGTLAAAKIMAFGAELGNLHSWLVCDLILDCAEYVSFVLHIVTYKYIVFYELESY